MNSKFSNMQNVAALALTGLALALTAPASAQTVTKGDIRVENAWSRQTPTGARVAGGFLRVTNTGKDLDRLVGGSVVNAKRIEIHEMAMDGGAMRMRELPKGLEIKPGETIELKPGSFHVMFMEIGTPAKTGETIKGTLEFEKAGTVDVTYKIAPLGATSPDGSAPKAGAADKMNHGAMKH